MNYVRRFLAFWYDFIIGDDWTIAVAVVVALALTALAVATGFQLWWLLPAAVIVFLGLSLWRASGS